jgi:sulfotransferase family protein
LDTKVKRPTFFVLGPARSGSASMYSYLKQHPEILMSSNKEPTFFQIDYEKGMKYYFRKYFTDWRGEKVIGEAAHRNLYLPYVAKRIKRECPNAKFIVILRNPIDRAYSHYWYQYSRGIEKLSFEDAIQHDFNRIESGVDFNSEKKMKEYLCEKGLDANTSYFRTYLDSGYYYEQLKRYYDLFPKDNILVLNFNDFIENPEVVMTQVFSFLDVDESYKLQPLKSNNKSRKLIIQQVIEYFTTRFRFRRYVPYKIKLWLLPVMEFLESLITVFWKKKDDRISQKSERFLKEVYAEQNKGMHELTGIDINSLMK